LEFDAETWHALQLFARDSMKSLQELADEAFRDLLRKHQRPVTLKDALRQSARRLAANDDASPMAEPKARKK
jgi:hypothetical protein